MLHAVEEGKMKAMYIVGEDMALVDSNANRVHDILSSLEFLVVQDVFLSKTAQYADVVLPASASLEKMELYKHGKTCPAVVSGAPAARRCEAGLGYHSRHRKPAWS